MNLKILAVAAASLMAASAQAGVTTIDFNNGTAPGFSGEYGLFTTGVGGIAAAPNATPFLAVPGPSANGGTATYSTGNFITSFSFDWGTPDSYNTLTFNGANNFAATYTGAGLAEGRYTYNFAAADRVTSVSFASSNRAFEIDNVAVAAVPEPATWGLMLAGFGLVGFAARRRASATVAA